MSSSVAEIVGAPADEEELIRVGEETYAVEAPLYNLNPISVAQHSGNLVMARRLDPETGGLLHIPQPHNYRYLPGKMDADEALAHLQSAAARSDIQIPAPPMVGEMQPFHDNAFAVKQRNPSETTAIVPYASPTSPFLTQLVRLVA
jgi:hypothetical protein